MQDFTKISKYRYFKRTSAIRRLVKRYPFLHRLAALKNPYFLVKRF